MIRCGVLVLSALVAAVPGGAEERPASPVPAALAFVHAYGRPDALTPGSDRAVKVKLMTALAKNPALTREAAAGLIDKDTFDRCAGGADALRAEALEKLVAAKVPPTRTAMHAKVRTHLDLLATQFDQIEDGHRKANAELVEWVARNYKPGRPLGVIAACTKNTRRSALGAAMGNLAASYCGLGDLRFFSGGADPDVINPRTVRALREVGIEVEPTGREAPRGKDGPANPIYRVGWGKGLEALEFSKRFGDEPNPRERFCALAVCGGADEACPEVPGADARVTVPYLDPKVFDGTPFEAAKYAERRDDMGRFMLSVVTQARRRLELDGRLK